jgi:acyl-CoA reductase-like NAD-dependent aldehyde dehydrogenase
MGLRVRYRIVAEMRVAAHRHVEALSKMAVEETGLGRVDHKETKNRLVIDKSPGPEILEPWAASGDDGLVLEEWAPYGVIAAITPCTNPSETIICNSIGMLAAGNAVVFNAHPSAKRVSAATVRILHDAVLRAGGPEGLICCTAEPTIDMAQRLMRHPGVRLLVVTGGPGVVKEAMGSGKKVIAAGPGNPPVVVDETADLSQAADGIVKGIGLDNNIVCTDEKEIIAVAAIADPLKGLLRQQGAYELSPAEVERLEKVVVQDGHANRRWVGKDAAVLLREIGISAPQSTPIVFGEVPESHPFVQLELLMPVTGLVRVADAREAIATAVRCEHGNHHTAAIYSKNIETMHRMARAMNTSIFTKNAPTYAGLGLGGEGYSSFTIASPTGEGLTNARHFSRRRRCTLKEHFRIV